MITRAGQAASASLPPLIRDRCLRTVFMAEIGAPEASSAAFTAASSCKVMPSGGAGSSDEPPPEISATTRSPEPSPPTRSSMRAAASSPAPSGTGWAAPTISMRWQGVA